MPVCSGAAFASGGSSSDLSFDLGWSVMLSSVIPKYKPTPPQAQHPPSVPCEADAQPGEHRQRHADFENDDGDAAEDGSPGDVAGTGTLQAPAFDHIDQPEGSRHHAKKAANNRNGNQGPHEQPHQPTHERGDAGQRGIRPAAARPTSPPGTPPLPPGRQSGRRRAPSPVRENRDWAGPAPAAPPAPPARSRKERSPRAPAPPAPTGPAENRAHP